MVVVVEMGDLEEIQGDHFSFWIQEKENCSQPESKWEKWLKDYWSIYLGEHLRLKRVDFTSVCVFKSPDDCMHSVNY